jgi:hypothetical protein
MQRTTPMRACTIDKMPLAGTDDANRVHLVDSHTGTLAAIERRYNHRL